MVSTQELRQLLTRRAIVKPWVAANALGLGLGMAVFAGVAESIEQSDILAASAGELVGHIIGLALAGAIFGLMQWQVLRRFVPVSRSMVAGTAVGLMLGYIVGYELGGPPVDCVLAPALAGVFGGFLQWHALGMLKRADGWPWVHGLSLLVGGTAGSAVALAGLGNALGGSLMAWIFLNGIVFAIAGAVGGAISGAWLRRLV